MSEDAEDRGYRRGRADAGLITAAAEDQITALQADVARLEGERNEALARANEAARLSAEARDQADDLRRLIADLREEIAIIDESRTEMLVIQLRLEGERDEAQAEVHEANALLANVDDDPTALVELYARTRNERDAMRAAVEAVLALHSPRPGWECEWKDPAEALREGWPPCAGCDLVGVGYREIGNCPTRKALAAIDQMGARTARSEPQSDAEGPGVAQDIQEALGAQTGAQGATEAAYEAGVAEGRRQAVAAIRARVGGIAAVEWAALIVEEEGRG